MVNIPKSLNVSNKTNKDKQDGKFQVSLRKTCGQEPRGLSRLYQVQLSIIQMP